ncbi:MAG: CCA tRNA nucleotidyltransferase [Eubacteriales bacterium]|nr:CCA tRNA nucleotidyltransferase [Eubacteriales bacterium]
MKINLPENVTYIINKLSEAGFEAYAVGGCVRDSILGRIPGDWDITTSALPHEVKKIFPRTIDTGIEHGTVTVLTGHGTYEVTTYRIDGEYEDGRHPKKVEFTRSLREDLKRRDFTINAMAYNDEEGLVDLFEGEEDLNRKCIRCVGNPDERFDEDALRILRAVRFSAQLGFEIESETRNAIMRHAAHLSAVSKERIYTEINKLICSPHMEEIETVHELMLSDYIAKGFGELKAIEAVLPQTDITNRYIRYAYLARGMEEDRIKKMLRELKADNDTIKGASLLGSIVMEVLPTDRYELKKVIGKIGREYFTDLLTMKEVLSGMESVKLQRELYEDITVRKEPIVLKDMPVDGKVAMELGIKAGPHLGEILNGLLDDVRRNPGHNTKEYLTGLIRKEAENG